MSGECIEIAYENIEGAYCQACESLFLHLTNAESLYCKSYAAGIWVILFVRDVYTYIHSTYVYKAVHIWVCESIFYNFV